MIKEEILKKYLELHNELGTQEDADDKGAFDIAHRKVWADCEVELKVRKVELESREIDSPELNELKTLFPLLKA